MELKIAWLKPLHPLPSPRKGQKPRAIFSNQMFSPLEASDKNKHGFLTRQRQWPSGALIVAEIPVPIPFNFKTTDALFCSFFKWQQKKRILAVAGRCRLSLTGRRSVRRGPPAQAGEAVPCRPAFSAARPSRACGGEAQLCRRLLCRPVQAADGGRRGPQPSRATAARPLDVGSMGLMVKICWI